MSAVTSLSKRRHVTLADQFIKTDGRPSGFDYMRITLALGVIFSHASFLSYGERADTTMAGYLIRAATILIVPMFFSLSGFLVAGSLERSKALITFLGLRVFRIAPALTVEVVLSALILGPLLTTLPLSSYFTDKEFYIYFLNIVGDIHYYLPGVFRSNPNTLVNGQLWTVPYELICYIALSIFAVCGIFKRREWLLIALGLFYLGQVGNAIFRPLHDMKVATGSTVVMSFIAGLVVYKYRDKLPWSFGWFLLMAVLSLAMVMMPNGTRFAALPIAYITVYLGLLNPPRNKIVLSGDYSYGLYLYGYPIQQAVADLGNPGLREWYWNLLIAVPCAILVAACSWWLVEKPVLNQRHVLKRLEAWYLKKRPKWLPA